MSWTWVIRMLVILVVVLVVVAGTVVALRLTDPGSEEAEEATPTAQEAAEMPATTTAAPAAQLPTPVITPAPRPLPTATPAPQPTADPELAAGDPCTPDLSAAIAAANESQSAFMRGEIDAAQLSATWGAMAARAQESAESLLAKTTDTYSVERITAIVPQLNTCTVQSVSDDGNEVVVQTQEVWTYDAVLSCTAAADEQTSRELVTYPGQEYSFVLQDDAWVMQNWNIGVVNIEPAWQCT